MSTAPTSSAHASAPTARTGTANATTARHAAANESGGDLFSSLLSLLSATHDLPADPAALGADIPNDKADASNGNPLAADGSGNPLAALLGWPGAPSLPGNAAAGGSPSPALASATDLAHGTPAAALAGNAPAAGAATSDTGVPLQGMTLLSAPTAPDADTLAALNQAATASPTSPEAAPRGLQPGAANDAAPAAGHTAATSRSASWRSTAGPASSAAATQHASSAVGHENWHNTRQALAAQSRSTVALDERFGQSSASDAPLAGASGVTAAGGAGHMPHPDSGSGSPGAAPDQNPLEPNTTESTSPTSTDAPTYLDAAHDTEDSAAAPWGAQNLRHASLRVGDGGEDAIDIQLTLAGQEVRVDFRTDNAEARASLAQDAGGSLGDLLQRSGIQLGSVSVGAQHQQQGEPGRAPVPTSATPRGRAAADSEATSATAPVQRLRSDGSRPLDLFV